MPHSGHALARTRHGPTRLSSTSSSTTLARGKPLALQNSTIPVATCSTLHSDIGTRAATTQEQIPVYRMSRNSGLTAYTDKHEPNDWSSPQSGHTLASSCMPASSTGSAGANAADHMDDEEKRLHRSRSALFSTAFRRTNGQLTYACLSHAHDC